MGAIDEAHLPYWLGALVVRVEHINAIVLGLHKHHVVRAFSGNAHIRHIQRLAVNLAVHTERKNLPKLRGFNVLRRQNCLAVILAASGVVVMLGQHSSKLRPGRREADNDEREQRSRTDKPAKQITIHRTSSSKWRLGGTSRCAIFPRHAPPVKMQDFAVTRETASLL